MQAKKLFWHYWIKIKQESNETNLNFDDLIKFNQAYVNKT